MNDSLSTIAISFPSGFRKFWHLKTSPPGEIGNCAVVTVTEGRAGGGGVVASGGAVLVGGEVGEELGSGVELDGHGGVGTVEDGIGDGAPLGGGAGMPVVVHCPAQNAVSWRSQKHRSAQVAQLAQAGALVHPVV